MSVVVDQRLAPGAYLTDGKRLLRVLEVLADGVRVENESGFWHEASRSWHFRAEKLSLEAALRLDLVKPAPKDLT